MEKNKTPHAIIIRADDWEGLFVDGVLVYEHHEISRRELRELCKEHKINFSEIEEGWVTDDYDEYLSVAGGFPEKLEDVEYE